MSNFNSRCLTEMIKTIIYHAHCDENHVPFKGGQLWGIAPN